MMDQNYDAIETFLAEDLLIGLGAIRLALSWAGDTPGGPTAQTLRSVERELAGLNDRARVFYREMRQTGGIGSDEVGAAEPALSPDAVPEPDTPTQPGAPRATGAQAIPGAPVDLDQRPENLGAEIHPLDPPSPRAKGEGLPPTWLSDAGDPGDEPPARDPGPQTAEPNEDLGQSIDQLLASALSANDLDETKAAG